MFLRKVFNKSIATLLAAILGLLLALSGCSNVGNDEQGLSLPTNAISVSPVETVSVTASPSLLPTSSSTLLPSITPGPSPTAAAPSSTATAPVNGDLVTTYIDVGQGDSELVQNGGQNLLIDTGVAESESAIVSTLHKDGVTKIDDLVLTHPHADHIGSADAIIKQFNVGVIFMTKATTNTKTFETLITDIKAKKLQVVDPTVGYTFNVGGASVVVDGPLGPETGDLNTWSIVCKVTYGTNSFLFTGDTQTKNEEAMLAKGLDFSCDVLKVAHHSSDTSSCQAFLNAAKPKISIISCGAGNTYGFPKQDTIDKLLNIGSQVYITELNGNIVVTSNGRDISVKAEKGSAITSNSDVPSSSTSPSPSQTKPSSQASTGNTSGKTIISVLTAADAGQQVVYWVKGGSCYHLSLADSSLSRSKTVYMGTVKEAIDAGIPDKVAKR